MGMKMIIAGTLVYFILLGAYAGKAAAAVTCDPMALSPCATAMFSPSKPKPTTDCCNKLKLQAKCMCKYATDPKLKGYIKTPDAKRVADSCHVSFPKC